FVTRKHLSETVKEITGRTAGEWISTLFGFGKVDGFNFGSFAVAVIGALVVLFIYRKIKS
ncbi:GlsB/YeaQ/YmgE family stress response membrane protein, partial [Enterobacter sp.]|uniref:GlsB/YeaQ/YmgE family stress response membrane protein n=1 Tax=Enterobacter sp. TaxID=42895 RepID=UPI0039E7265D